MPEHMARSREAGCMLVPCMVGEIPILCMFGDHGKAGRGYLLACCLHPCWKAGVREPAQYWKIPCSLWQCLCGRLLTNVGDLGQRGGLRTLQMVISLSAGKATSGRACLLPRRGWLEMFRAIRPFLCWWGRKDPLCQGQIYLDSFVFIRHLRPSFYFIYLNYPHCWFWNCTTCKTVQHCSQFFPFYLLEAISRKLNWKSSAGLHK